MCVISARIQSKFRIQIVNRYIGLWKDHLEGQGKNTNIFVNFNNSAKFLHICVNQSQAFHLIYCLLCFFVKFLISNFRSSVTQSGTSIENLLYCFLNTIQFARENIFLQNNHNFNEQTKFVTGKITQYIHVITISTMIPK